MFMKKMKSFVVSMDSVWCYGFPSCRDSLTDLKNIIMFSVCVVAFCMMRLRP